MANRIKIFIGLCILFIFTVILIYAEPLSQQSSEIAEVLSEICNRQNVEANEAIIPEKVSSEQLTKLGKAVIAQFDSGIDAIKSGEDQDAEKQMLEIYKIIGYRYIESGFKLVETEEMYNFWIEGKGAVTVDGFNSEAESNPDYAGFSFSLYILALIIIIILISVFHRLKRKAAVNRRN